MTIAWWAWPLIGLLGAAGALARYSLDGLVSGRTDSRFPLGTLAVNLSGALILGFLSGAGLTGQAWLLIGTAGIGAYTTFSTLMLETERLLEDGDNRQAALNVCGSMALGLAMVALGWAAGRLL